MPKLKFKKGDIVFSESPYVDVVSDGVLDQMCSYCHKVCDLKPCKGCRTIEYCSRKCRRKDRADHSAECVAVQRSSGERLDSESRLVVKALTKYYRELKQDSTSVGNWFGIKRTIVDLVSHVNQLATNATHYNEVSTKAERIIELVGDIVPCSLDVTIEMIQRMRINTFGATTSTGHPSIIAVHLGASRFDHSCEPEVRITYFFDGRKIVFRALDDFVCDRDELRISYLPPLMSYASRQKRLADSYYFECDCRKCWEDHYADRFEDECELELIEKVEALAEASCHEIYTNAYGLLKKMSHLPENNYWLFQLRRLMQNAALAEEDYYGSLQQGYLAAGATNSPTYRTIILYRMFIAMRALGWHEVNHDYHDLYLDCFREGYSLAKMCCSRRHKVTVEFREARGKRVKNRIIRELFRCNIN